MKMPGKHGLLYGLLLLHSALAAESSWLAQNNKVDDNLENKVISRQKRSKTSNEQLTPGGCKECQTLPADCLAVQEAGNWRSGVYTIQPPGLPALKVNCDLETRGGGWTVFQRRVDGNVDFYRGWTEYSEGFGDIYGDYWLGLRNIHLLTHSKPMELLLYFEDFQNASRYAAYDFFAVGSEYTKFHLDLGSYFGTAGDSLSYHRGGQFSTKDNDNDSNKGSCASLSMGAWWYKSCFESNLNGRYLQGAVNAYGVVWKSWKGLKYSLKTSVMMIRPKY